MAKKEKRGFGFRGIGIIIILIGVIVGLMWMKNIKVKQNIVTLSSKLDEKVEKIAEVSTVEYNYTNIVEYNNTKNISGLDLPFTNKMFLVQYKGRVKAGFEFDDIKFKVVDKDTVKVTMNPPKILENIIDEDDVYFFNERDTIFNKLKFDDLYDILKDEKEKMEKTAIEEGLLEDAKKNSEDVIRLLLEDMGFKNIDISFNE